MSDQPKLGLWGATPTDHRVIPVFWWSAHRDDGIIGRLYWCTEWIESILAETVWKVSAPVTFLNVEAQPDCPTITDGGILVIPGDHHTSAEDIGLLNDFLARLDWAVVVIVSNEESGLDVNQLVLPQRHTLWVQSPHPTFEYPLETRYVGWWWRPGTLETLDDFDDIQDRPDNWAYLGQANTPSRTQLVETLTDRLAVQQDGTLLSTSGFGQGMAQIDYLSALLHAKVAPAPAGPYSADSFRLYEALEAGCLPIIESRAPHDPLARDQEAPDGFWDRLYPGHPLDLIDVPWGSWPEFDGILTDLLDGGCQLQTNRVQSWWQQTKRQTVYRLMDDIAQLSGGKADTRLPVTVVICTSSIPSHPDTRILEQTIASIRAYPQLADADILVLCDGIREEQTHRADDYHEYVRRLLRLCARTADGFRNVLPIVHETHQHQARLVRDALPLILTPLLLFVEHDTPLQDPIDWEGCIRLLLGSDDDPFDIGQLDMLRFHHEQRILPSSEHMMLDHGDPIVDEKTGIPYLRTAQFSARPHLARVDYYTRILTDHFRPHERWFIEDRMHSICQSAWWDRGAEGWKDHRLAVYTPFTPEIGGFQRSNHTDGRADDTKFDLVEGQ